MHKKWLALMNVVKVVSSGEQVSAGLCQKSLIFDWKCQTGYTPCPG